jgi:hypothetical protein
MILKFLSNLHHLRDVVKIDVFGRENPILELELIFYQEIIKNPEFQTSESISDLFMKFISKGLKTSNILYRYQTITLVRELFLRIQNAKYKGIQPIIYQNFLKVYCDVLFQWLEECEKNMIQVQKKLDKVQNEINQNIEDYSNDRTRFNMIGKNIRAANNFFEELNVLLKEKREEFSFIENELIKETMFSRNEKEYFFACFFQTLDNVDLSNKDKIFISSILHMLKISVEFFQYQGKETIQRINEIFDNLLENHMIELSKADTSKRLFYLIFDSTISNKTEKSAKKFFTKSLDSKMMKRISSGSVKEKNFDDRVKNRIKFEKQLGHNVGLNMITSLKQIIQENEELFEENSSLREDVFEILMNLCRNNFSESVKINSLLTMSDLFDKFGEKVSKIKSDYRFEFLHLQENEMYSRHVKVILKK